MKEQLKRIADALERLAEIKEIEVAGLVEAEPDDETGDDLPPSGVQLLSGGSC